PRDQRRSLAISQREPLIPHRSARDTAAPRTPREAPQSSSRASGERERAGEREHAEEGRWSNAAVPRHTNIVITRSRPRLHFTSSVSNLLELFAFHENLKESGFLVYQKLRELIYDQSRRVKFT
ncbi:unnamed protein product, partial [Pleuronectes platessa]